DIRDGSVFINGTQLNEDYTYAQPDEAAQPTTVSGDEHSWGIPAGELFLMGDHRQNSADSRTFGPVPISQIIGRAWLRYWPLNTFAILRTPTYPDLPPASPGPDVDPAPGGGRAGGRRRGRGGGVRTLA